MMKLHPGILSSLMVCFSLSSCGSATNQPLTVSWSTLEEAQSICNQIANGDSPRDFILPDPRCLKGKLQNQTMILSRTSEDRKLPLEEVGPYEDGFPILSYSSSGSYFGYSVDATIITHGMEADGAITFGAYWGSNPTYVAVTENRCVVKFLLHGTEEEVCRFDVSLSKGETELSNDEIAKTAISFALRCLGDAGVLSVFGG